MERDQEADQGQVSHGGKAPGSAADTQVDLPVTDRSFLIVYPRQIQELRVAFLFFHYSPNSHVEIRELECSLLFPQEGTHPPGQGPGDPLPYHWCQRHDSQRRSFIQVPSASALASHGCTWQAEYRL